MKCRHCSSPLIHTFLDLGFAPPSNAYLNEEDLTKPEMYYPLRLKVCTECWLVQTEDYASAEELFCPDYAYFSSASSSWLTHAKNYVVDIKKQLDLGASSLVIEIASNDGYLLRNFVEAEIPCFGVEPTTQTADAAEKTGVPVLREFFSESLGRQLAEQGKMADLVIGNNVYAHVPDINDFTRGLKAILKPSGTITLEFPHLAQLIEHTQFDTVYHEHFSYFSLFTVGRIFAKAGLRIFDVQELPTHGGSLRVFGCHVGDARPATKSVGRILVEEESRGLRSLETYSGFQSKSDRIKNNLLKFLLAKKDKNQSLMAYGAAAKGNTLLNYAGIKTDLLPMVCDTMPAKQGRFMPGSHIPIVGPEMLREVLPDFVLILPWNIANEVAEQHSYIHEWGGRFVLAGSSLEIMDPIK